MIENFDASHQLNILISLKYPMRTLNNLHGDNKSSKESRFTRIDF